MMNKNIFSVVNSLVAINILMFVLSHYVFKDLQTTLPIYYIDNPNFRIHQFVTHLFMHASPTHLLFNMIGLWSFGRLLESRWGTNRFIIFYLLCGIGAALIYLGVNHYQYSTAVNEVINAGVSSKDMREAFINGQYYPSIDASEKASFIFGVPSVGASGAIYGILIAFAWLFPNYKMILIFIPYPIKSKYFVPVLIAIDLFSGVTGFSIFGANIAHFAHIGGAIIGFLLMWLWLSKTSIRNDIR